jgi:hypothetical protein
LAQAVEGLDDVREMDAVQSADRVADEPVAEL